MTLKEFIKKYSTKKTESSMKADLFWMQRMERLEILKRIALYLGSQGIDVHVTDNEQFNEPFKEETK